MAIKAQTLADFIAEFMPSLSDATDQPNNASKATEHALVAPVPPDGDFWNLYVNGASNYKGSGAGMVLVTPDGSMLEQTITLGFKASNNKAEYETLLAGFRMAKDLAVKKLVIHYDSQLITSQTTGKYTAKHLKMAQYLEKANNAQADVLADLGFALDNQLKRSIPVKYLDKPSIEAELAVEVSQVSTTPNWQDSIIDYLVNGTLLTERLESRKLQTKATRYTEPYLHCLAPPDDLKVLSSIHESVYGNHAEGISLAEKALNAGYYWPTMH
ncbi:uncharacterized protein [Pyrus communis]|uniref:uncharacterized protein n=1 Tax=Pyrus communis TaxID=23211 RepID=UPI0035C19F94